MDGGTLRSTLVELFPEEEIQRLARQVGFLRRARKKDVQSLVVALVLTAGSDDSGRQADVYEAYLAEADLEVVRGSFYAWFNAGLAYLMLALARRAMDFVGQLPPLLTGDLGKVGVADWILVDSETVTLPDALAETFPATSTPAGLKVHKYWSVGRNNIVDIELSPARDHDGPLLRLDERWRGMGLIVDLGYASFQLIRECQRLEIGLVIRLKNGWKPRMLRTIDEFGQLLDVDGEPVLDDLLEMDTSDYDGSSFDFDVAFGSASNRVTARLVGVPGSEAYHWSITLLPRAAASPALVCTLYRARWEIEIDNKRDKGGARLDQIDAEKPESVYALVYSSLLRTMIANHLVYLDLRDRPRDRAPLHGMAVALALNVCWHVVTTAIELDEPKRWDKLARVIRARGHDPNWRHRPSVLDRLRGITAPPRLRRSSPRGSGPSPPRS